MAIHKPRSSSEPSATRRTRLILAVHKETLKHLSPANESARGVKGGTRRISYQTCGAPTDLVTVDDPITRA